LVLPAWADIEAAKAFLDAEIGDLSTLDRAGQEAELQWFIDAAKPYAGMEIKVVSETIGTHMNMNPSVLAPAFTAITGIKVTHDLIGEGDVVEKLQTQMQSGENIYDAYINDSDLIGTHWRYQLARNLTDWMAGEGAAVTNPNLDIADFIGTKFTTAPDGELYQLPDQQFANLYWFRYDWFNDQKTKDDFKAKYGYDLGVPVNWSAYEDIAEFFTGRDMSYMGGPASASMATWITARKTPRWAGAIRTRGCRWPAWATLVNRTACRLTNGASGLTKSRSPVGSCVTRGGSTNDAAAVYAVTKAIEWLQKYTPPEAQGMTFGEAGPVPAQGAIAQQMFWYTAFTAASVEPGTPVMNEDGTPKWRMAPSPHGVYWQEGQKIGYQDVGSWTLMKSTPVDRAQAAWLYAQFVTSKTIDVKKAHVGLTFVRESTIQHDSFTERAPKLGGLIEFYRSPARVQWSPTGTNIPDYPKMAQLWWQNIGDAMSGAKTPQEALDALCEEQEKVLERIERSGVQGDIGPKMGEPQDPQVWLDAPGAPVAKLENEDEEPKTIAYDELIKSWQN
jgi:glycerol transport system substrate-binding protein